MWKKSLTRGALGFCISAAAIVVSGLITGLCGAEHTCMPAFIERVGSEITAVYLQTFLMSLIGFAFGASSVLFEMERWSFLKQGAAHLTITAAVWILMELICFSPITPPVVLAFGLSAAGTYAVTWSIQYFLWRRQVRQLNEQIHRLNGGGSA